MTTFLARLSGPLMCLCVAACGGTTSDDGHEPATTTTTNSPMVQSGSAVEYFHHMSANLAVDHAGSRFAFYQHDNGSDAAASACGLVGSKDGGFAPGSSLDLGAGALYPAPTGGGMRVSRVEVKSLDSGKMVVHVSMLNGTEFDETWERGLGTACEGDCLPDLETCPRAL